ncbi:Agamous-like MADS-box protein AGL61 [Linum grandiflorum]
MAESSTAAAKKTKGKQKISIQRIDKAETRSVTFSKRRSGLYKQASEMVTLCGAEVGILFFSPIGKPYTYGFPSIEAVGDRLLQPAPAPADVQETAANLAARRFNTTRDRQRMDELNMRVIELQAEAAATKERAAALKATIARRREKEAADWWDLPVEDWRPEELQTVKSEMESLVRRLEE